METTILVDIHCNWEVDPPAYRLYVDDDLLTERSYIWRDQFVQEHAVVELKPGTHSVRVEPVNPGDAYRFNYTVRIDDKQVSSQFNI